MAVERRQKLVIANAVNMVVEINERLNNSTRKGIILDMRLPLDLSLAFMVHHRAGVVPMEEIVSVGDNNDAQT